MRAVEDHHVDRPEVEREQSPQLTGTNRSIGLIAGGSQNRRTTARVQRQDPHAAPAKTLLPPSPHSSHPNPSEQPIRTTQRGGLAGLVAIARGQTPDPIPNSAVKTLCANGTAAQAAEE